MLLDGIYVMFIHKDFELDILQICLCSLFLCSVVVKGLHQFLCMCKDFSLYLKNICWYLKDFSLYLKDIFCILYL